MTDSGVDTSNENSDSNDFDHSSCGLEFSPPAIPIDQFGKPMSIDCLGEPASHDHVGKMKCSTKSRHCRLMYRYGGILSATRNEGLRLAASTNNTSMVDRLLKSGADPNSSDKYKRSPLHVAACHGYTEVVKLLLKHGANPNIKDSLGNTPLHLAACTNHIPVVIQLLDAGTDVRSNDRNGKTPLQLAQSKLRLIRMRPNAVGPFDETKQLVQEVCLVIDMMLKYIEIQKVDSGDLVSMKERLGKLSTRAEIDSEVQNLLDNLDSLKL